MERIESIRIEAEERGWELVVETDETTYRFHAHGAASSGGLRAELTLAVDLLDEWENEGRAAAAAHARDLDARRAEETLDATLAAADLDRDRRDVC